MQRTNMNNVDEFGIEMQTVQYNADHTTLEGGADNIEGGAEQVFNNIDNMSADQSNVQTSFVQEMTSWRHSLDEIRYKGLTGYWAMQTTASKVTHGIVGVVSMILSLNFVMAMIAHFSWDRAYLGHHLAEDEILILYCQTQGCGCENGVLHRIQQLVYEHLAGDENSENVKVYTQLYPGAPLIQFFSRFFQLIQILLILTIFFGPMICRKVYGYGAGVADKANIRYPYFVQKLAVGGCCKKIGMFLLCFIGLNIVVALLTISGAFEIYHGSDLVFSSLESKRMVTPRDLIDSFPRLDGKESPLMSMEDLDVPVGHMH